MEVKETGERWGWTRQNGPRDVGLTRVFQSKRPFVLVEVEQILVTSSIIRYITSIRDTFKMSV